MIWFVLYWLISGVIVQVAYFVAYNIFSEHSDVIPEEYQSDISDFRVYIKALRSSGNEPLLLLILLVFGFIILPVSIFEAIKEML